MCVGGGRGARGSQFSKYMYFVLKRNLGLNKMEQQTSMPAKVMDEATQESKCATFPPYCGSGRGSELSVHFVQGCGPFDKCQKKT